MTHPEVQPFRIKVPDEALADLNARLDRTRWPDDPAGAGTAYGLAQDYLRHLVQHWSTTYDWRRHEAHLNSREQFRTVVDGAPLHFIHERAREPGGVPLLLVHGWPSTVLDYVELIGPLTAPSEHAASGSPAFDVVIPSLPGFGFSGPAPEVGWDTRRIAAALLELMDRLGYDQFVAVGGDLGERISRTMAIKAPQRVMGAQLLGAYSSPPPGVNWFGPGSRISLDRTAFASSLGDLSPEELRIVEDRLSWDWSTAYASLQASRPHTLSYAMNDSPAGMLAWIAEKFVEWTDWADSPEEAVSVDQLLTTASIYWFTETFSSAARIYRDEALAGPSNNSEWNPVPTGTSVFARETSIPLRAVVERTNQVVAWTEHDRGGHFPALEEPDLVVDDIRGLWRAVQLTR